MKIAALALAIAALLSARGSTGSPARSDEEQLRANHETILRAHREGDLAAWMSIESDRYDLVNRGEITHPTKAEREKFLGPYLAGTRFREYRDLVAPIVRVSRDGSLGWLIAQVQAAGVRTDASGRETPIAFTSAWIELYEKRDGRWLCVGNVSNFKE
ncbi:MAG TPA: nuclear transport factor 2 family protein [Thermoanaerobaculia bacterium]